MRAIVWLVPICLALIACGSKGPPFWRVSDVQPGMAIVYAYRDGSKGPNALVRLERYGTCPLGDQDYTYWEVDAGRQRIMMHWSGRASFYRRYPRMAREIKRRFRVRAGKTYYYKVSVDDEGDYRDLDWSFEPVDEEIALSELRRLYYKADRVPHRPVR